MYCVEMLNDYLSCLAKLSQRKVTKLANILTESKKQEIQKEEAIFKAGKIGEYDK